MQQLDITPDVTVERFFFLAAASACVMLLPVVANLYGLQIAFYASYVASIAVACIWYGMQLKECKKNISSVQSALILVAFGPIGAGIVCILSSTQLAKNAYPEFFTSVAKCAQMKTDPLSMQIPQVPAKEILFEQEAA